MAIKRRGRSYYAIFYYGGKQRWRSFPTRKQAELFLSQMRVNKAKGELDIVENKKISFEVFSLKWLENYSKVNKALSSHIRDVGVVNQHLIPYFAGTYLKTINEEKVNQYILHRRAQNTYKGTPPANNTINRELEILSKMLNSAVDWNYLTKLPLRRVKKLSIQAKPIEYLTKKEVSVLLQATEPEYLPLFATAVYSGLRLGELLNLKKSHIDMANKLIKVEIGSALTNRTKSGRIRHVPISTSLMPYLEQTMKTKGEYAFPNNAGGMRKEIRRALWRAAKKAGITRHIYPHLLRHTFASNYVMAGGDLYSLKDILGHSTLLMVQRYAHLSQEYLRKNIELLKF